MENEKIQDIAKTYAHNEDENKHAENVLLLAENFGTQEDVVLAKVLLTERDQGTPRRVEIKIKDQDFDTYLWEKTPEEFQTAYDATCPDSEEEEEEVSDD